MSDLDDLNPATPPAPAPIPPESPRQVTDRLETAPAASDGEKPAAGATDAGDARARRPGADSLPNGCATPAPTEARWPALELPAAGQPGAPGSADDDAMAAEAPALPAPFHYAEPAFPVVDGREIDSDGAGGGRDAGKAEPGFATASIRSAVAAAPPSTVSLGMLGTQAARYAAQSHGAGTRRAYGSAWTAFAAWCAAHRRDPLCGDPGLVALYLTQRADAGLAVSSLQVARAAIRAAHRLAGIPLDLGDPRLAMVMEGISRSQAARPRRQAAAAIPDLLRRLLSALPAPNTPDAAAPALAARHRAMLLIGFGAALRRSEIVALTVGDVNVVDGRGLAVRVRRSKTDQHGHGRSIAIWANHRDPDFCAVTAFAEWMGFRRTAPDWTAAAAEPPPLPHDPRDLDARRAEQPLFCGVTSAGALTGTAMSDKIVARMIKQACLHAGIDPARFSGHSLRRGLLTAAGDLQLPLVDLMRQSRHKSVDTALTYIEAGDAWRNNITEPVFGGLKPTGG